MGTAASRIRTRPDPRPHVRQTSVKHRDFWGGDSEPGAPGSGSWRNGGTIENFDSRSRRVLEIGEIPRGASANYGRRTRRRVGAFQ